jgi:nucleoid-associated protein YgaU
MSKFAFLTSGAGVTVGAGATIVTVIGVAGYVSGAFSSGDISSAPLADISPVVEVARVVEPGLEPKVETSVEPIAPRIAETAAAPKTPSFDVVRVDGDGTAMIAGSAEAGSTVSIQLDAGVVAQVKADAGGKFASFVALPESTEARVLTLLSDAKAPSSERVIIAPSVAPAVQTVPEIEETSVEVAIAEEEKVGIVDDMQKPDTAAKTTPDIVEDVAPSIVANLETDQANQATRADEVVETAAVEEIIAPVTEALIDVAKVETPQQPVVGITAPQIPVVILATDEGVRVLQSPDAPAPDAMTTLLGSITYDDAGDVSLTGNASGDFVRVYLDNRPIATSQIEENGDWQAGLPSVDTGIYTLRVDELNEAGDVVARVETPFKREAAEVLAAASKPEKLVQAITVQPGATLWAIAKEQYGSGTLYARVVEANADTIRNPDLIYPGQVFTVPD